MSYIDELIANCQIAKNSSPLREYEFDNLTQLDDVSKAIYIIEDLEKTFIEFARYKATKERACSKLNFPSRVMYVGSSSTGVKKRIKEHLGDGSKSTYSLHLKHWFKGKYRIMIKEYGESPEVLQIVEDDLSDRLNPAFGKKGGNNK